MYNQQLTAFICVADCGSFSKAAEKLFISPTAVMKQINALEAHLSLKLLTRTNRGIRLTSAGESIYKDAKSFIANSSKAVQRAKEIAEIANYTICIGTSMLNPCKPFMDLWYRISDQFPKYKIHIVPFEDDQSGILDVVSSLGISFDFLIGACDSSQWLSRCDFFELGTYRHCVSVPVKHRLASKTLIDYEDLYGETLVMVQRGDSPSNDRIRDEILKNHPQIHIENTGSFYDIGIFNRCAKTGSILLSLECWQDIHPSLINIPIAWESDMPYGLLYATDPPADILEFVHAIGSSRR